MPAEKAKRINILDKHVAELIAAGEVVERPASVVKELAENSVDAGAENISVSIKNGGTALIQITDDGCGIREEDVPSAFLRHATSKIQCADDLDSIATLGFRGEALASVAAVARVEMFTKTADGDFGSHYVTEGGEEKLFESAGCADGTTIIIRDLFYNTPARMKFLKKDVSEGNAVAAVVEKLALSHPEISFKFIRDGKEVLHTPGGGDLKSAIYAVLGRKFTSEITHVDYTLANIHVSGFVTRPVSCRTSRSMQYFYINGRYVKSATAMAALEAAYKNSIMVGKFPGCVLNIEVPWGEVDVNVHPAKTEVRFSNDRPVFEAVYHAVRSAIETGDAPPVMELSDKDESRAQPAPVQEPAVAPYVKGETETHYAVRSGDIMNYTMSRPQIFRPSLDIFPADDTADAAEPDTGRASIQSDAGMLPQSAAAKGDISQENTSAQSGEDSASGETSAQESFFADTAEAEPHFIGEVFSTYIIIELGDNVVFIDKHAAHERIIFERLKGSMSRDRQLLLTPVVIRLGSDDYSALLQNLDTAESCGFEIDDFGQGSVAVRSLPQFLDISDAEDVVTQMADRFKYGRMASSDKIDWILHTTACRAAIKAGSISSEAELTELAKRVVADGGVRYCPHGRPTAFVLKRTDIEKQFKRIV